MSKIFATILRQEMRQLAPCNKITAQMWRYYSAPMTNEYSKEALSKLVKDQKVVVFMKGNPEKPMCGFSNAVVQILRMHGVNYSAHDVLKSDDMRQGIKDFTEWPTIPQVFINGEFVGGCDILLQMHQSGDLIEKLKEAGIKSELLQQAKSSNQNQEVEK